MAGGTKTIQMDYEVIESVAKGFSAQQAALNLMDKALTGAIMAAKTMGLVMPAVAKALEQYLKNVQDKVRALAKICGEFARDLRGAIAAHKTGDVASGKWFQQGINL